MFSAVPAVFAGHRPTGRAVGAAWLCAGPLPVRMRVGAAREEGVKKRKRKKAGAQAGGRSPAPEGGTPPGSCRPAVARGVERRGGQGGAPS